MRSIKISESQIPFSEQDPSVPMLSQINPLYIIIVFFFLFSQSSCVFFSRKTPEICRGAVTAEALVLSHLRFVTNKVAVRQVCVRITPFPPYLIHLYYNVCGLSN